MSDKFGEAIDKLENLAFALKMPLRDSMHVNQLRTALPEVVAELKAAYVHEFGDNPWEE
jgi:hypothetical protein